mgnify:CR=1 FL=1
MLTSYFRINKNRKGGMGLTDFFSILAFILIFIVFIIIIKLSVRDTQFELSTLTSNVENSISMINMLRTPIKIDTNEISIAEMISLSKIDSSKGELARKTILQLMDDYYGTNACAIICIDDEKIKGSGCSALQTYRCPKNIAYIPSYNNVPIAVSFEADTAPVNFQTKPLK